MLTQKRTKLARGLGALSVAALAAVSLQIGYNDAFAKGGGGTATPPKLPPPAPTATCTVGPAPCADVKPPAGPALPNVAPLSSQFNIIGFIQDATVDGGCVAAASPPAPPNISGGTVTVNGTKITVPTNTILQFPANTLTWADAVCPTQAGVSAIGLNGTGGQGVQVSPPPYPSTEINVVGNIVNAGGAPDGIGDQHIAGLILISQQFVNAGTGYISFIDYNDGSIYVSTAGGETRLIINDPNGRYGRAQSSVDVRFSVDDANPTITADRSGYPMCVPRVAPAAAGQPESDPLCPQVNRPKAPNCRNFTAAGFTLRAGDFAATQTNPAGTYCSAFVMKALNVMPGATNAAAANAANIAGAGDPDPRQQVPFEVGDYITWQGTLVVGGNLKAPIAARSTTTKDVIWVHTIAANVGAYTQPKTLPAYIAIKAFNLGVNPQPSNVPAIAGLEATPRINLDSATTDLGSIVDVYLDDRKIAVGNPNNPILSLRNERFRWVTTEAMTGTLLEQSAGKLPFLTSAQPFGGGIETQFVGPQPGRARMRAVKIPAIDPTLGACPLTAGSQACAVTQSPTRYVRVALRQLCAPAAGFAAGQPTGNPGNYDGGAYFDINGSRGNLPGAGAQIVNPADPTAPAPPTPDGSCLQSAQYANGLFTGQYFAPAFNFIFAEAILGGAPITPANFWQLDFIAHGENGTSGASQPGPQIPQPW